MFSYWMDRETRQTHMSLAGTQWVGRWVKISEDDYYHAKENGGRVPKDVVMDRELTSDERELMDQNELDYLRSEFKKQKMLYDAFLQQIHDIAHVDYANATEYEALEALATIVFMITDYRARD